MIKMRLSSLASGEMGGREGTERGYGDWGQAGVKGGIRGWSWRARTEVQDDCFQENR
jgi:hypothetical protein